MTDAILFWANLIPRVKLVHHTPEIRLGWRGEWVGGVPRDWLQVTARVQDTNTGEWLWSPPVNYPLPAPREVLASVWPEIRALRIIRDLLLRFWLSHELDEAIRLDGVRIFDPHRP